METRPPDLEKELPSNEFIMQPNEHESIQLPIPEGDEINEIIEKSTEAAINTESHDNQPEILKVEILDEEDADETKQPELENATTPINENKTETSETPPQTMKIDIPLLILCVFVVIYSVSSVIIEEYCIRTFV